MANPARPPARTTRSHRSTLSLQKTEIIIHAYDLLPPGKFASFLWGIGTSLLHSGVVIKGREYAFGGTDQPGLTGVYWAPPKVVPPGGTFKCEILHGFTLASQEEIDDTIKRASEEFLGTGYNLLTRNCNHFTSYLCEKLTGRPGPAWLNRAAAIGVALPCVVPREWIEPPDYSNTDGGELLDEDTHADERSRMLRSSVEQTRRVVSESQARRQQAVVEYSSDEWNSEDERRKGGTGKGKGKVPVRDSSGRRLPTVETAPQLLR